MPETFSSKMIKCDQCREWFHLGLCVPFKSDKKEELVLQVMLSLICVVNTVDLSKYIIIIKILYYKKIEGQTTSHYYFGPGPKFANLCWSWTY